MLRPPFEETDARPAEDGIVVISRTPPMMCGGTDATQDTRAPKVIRSGEMLVFDVSSALNPGMGAYAGTSLGMAPGMGMMIAPGGAAPGTGAAPAAGGGSEPAPFSETPLSSISAFAAAVGGGTFLFLWTATGSWQNTERKQAWALVREDVMPALTALVREYDLARSNGFHSVTHGLPQNFGGSVDIRYASGERISFSNNQSSLFSQEFAQRVAAVFDTAMKGEHSPLPDVAGLKGLRFHELRKDGGYTKAEVSFAADGTGLSRREYCYEGEHFFQNEKTLDAETVSQIRSIVEHAAMFVWKDLPEGEYFSLSEKTMELILEDGTAWHVPENCQLPLGPRNGFFEIQMKIV